MKNIRLDQVLNIESEKCIGCGNCVRVCQDQNVACLELKSIEGKKKSYPIANKPCIACGQCTLKCPVRAIETNSDIEKAEKALHDPQKKIMVQFAPSVRVSLAEDFGGSPGEIVTGKIISALKKLGADFVVDDTTSADFTTAVEAYELWERVKENKILPMISSCCPAWVNFVEYLHPEIIPHLTAVRSPHIILGGLFKHHFAKERNLHPQDIFVISIMPCTAKKTDILRSELKHQNILPVDVSLTVREFSRLLKKNKIDLMKLDDAKPDSLISKQSGSGSIYGSSGGVTESVLRSLYFFATKKNLENIEFQSIRGIKGVKEAKVTINGKEIKAAAVSGLLQIKLVLDSMSKYHYIEVMACPGGCLGGGGQLFSISEEVKEKRSRSLYQIDEKDKIRLAHQNPAVREILFNEKSGFSFSHPLFITKYTNKS